MLFRLLVDGKNVYSLGRVIKRLEKGRYLIACTPDDVIIQTSKKIKPNEWVRFNGVFDENEIVCDFIEILTKVNVNLIQKFFNKEEL